MFNSNRIRDWAPVCCVLSKLGALKSVLASLYELDSFVMCQWFLDNVAEKPEELNIK